MQGYLPDQQDVAAELGQLLQNARTTEQVLSALQEHMPEQHRQAAHALAATVQGQLSYASGQAAQDAKLAEDAHRVYMKRDSHSPHQEQRDNKAYAEIQQRLKDLQALAGRLAGTDPPSVPSTSTG